jgi:hypothetical protein
MDRGLWVGSATAIFAIAGLVHVIGAFVVGRRAEDFEVAVEVDVDLAAIVFGDLDLVIDLFVTGLGAGNAAAYAVECDAPSLLEVGSTG